MYMQDVCPEISNPEQDPAACEPDTDNMAGTLPTTLHGLLKALCQYISTKSSAKIACIPLT